MTFKMTGKADGFSPCSVIWLQRQCDRLGCDLLWLPRFFFSFYKQHCIACKLLWGKKNCSNSIKCTKMCARNSFCLLHGHCWSEQSAVNWGKQGQISWTPPPQPPSSSTPQITLVVASPNNYLVLFLLPHIAFEVVAAWLLSCLSSNSIPACHRSQTPPPDMNR